MEVRRCGPPPVNFFMSNTFCFRLITASVSFKRTFEDGLVFVGTVTVMVLVLDDVAEDIAFAMACVIGIAEAVYPLSN